MRKVGQVTRLLTSFWALALGVALLSAPVLAQQQGGGRRGGFRGGVSILRLPTAIEARLNLTVDQKARFQALNERVRSEGRGSLAQGSTPEERRAAFRKLLAAREKAEIEAVALLNDAQKKQYEELKAEAASYAGLGGTSVALLSVSNLTADQKSKLQALAKEAAAKRRQASQNADREAAVRERRALDDAHRTAVKAILTPAQQQQFDAAIEASRSRRPGN